MEYTLVELLIISVVALFTWLWIRSRRPKDYPPGPTPLPVLGNLLNIPNGDFLQAVRDHRKTYGDFFTLSLGSFWVIVVNGAYNIRELVTKQGEHMLDRPPIYILQLNESYGKEIICPSNINLTSCRLTVSRCLNAFVIENESAV